MDSNNIETVMQGQRRNQRTHGLWLHHGTDRVKIPFASCFRKHTKKRAIGSPPQPPPPPHVSLSLTLSFSALTVSCVFLCFNCCRLSLRCIICIWSLSLFSICSVSPCSACPLSLSICLFPLVSGSENWNHASQNPPWLFLSTHSWFSSTEKCAKPTRARPRDACWQRDEAQLHLRFLPRLLPFGCLV